MTPLAPTDEEYHPPPSAPRALWLISFADLSCLLLTFFVLIFSMSTLNREKWPEVASALSRQRVTTDAPETSLPNAQYNIATTVRKRAINLDYLHAVLRDTLAADARLRKVRLQLLEDRIVISLPGDLIFSPGSAVLDRNAAGAVFELGGLLSNITNPVAVIGHTDRGPMRGSAFTSAWELTVGRAAAVANLLKRAGYTRDVAVLGAGNGRYAEVEALPANERDGAARRVDLVILGSGE